MRKSVHTGAYHALCQLLVAARHKAGLSQAELAVLLGRPQSFVAKYEGGERRLDLIEFLELAALLGFDERRAIRTIKDRL